MTSAAVVEVDVPDMEFADSEPPMSPGGGGSVDPGEPQGWWARLMRILIDWKDSLAYSVRSRKMSQQQVRKAQRDAANDPDVQRAIEKAVNERRLRGKASNGGGIHSHSD